jgi:acyl-CoA thioesterase FadM
VATPRGHDADWRNPWPVQGVRRGEPDPSPGVATLRADGFAAAFDVEPLDTDRDEYQDHLNNTAVVRMFNELRIAYVAARFAPRWPRHVRREGLTVAVRELHVLYESEGWMHERYVGATRVTQRRDKAAVVEQRLVEASTARPLARAWVLQLLVGGDGRVTEWPGFFWEMVLAVQGAPVHTVPDPTRPSWGPPP